MKSTWMYALFCVLLSLILWLGNAVGPATVQGADRTGSPLSTGSCNSCHAGGNFSPSISVQLLDGVNPVTQYQPNKAYTLRVRITASGNPGRYGFQAVALTGSDDSNAGAFGAAPAGFRVVTLSGRAYAEQSSPRTSNTMDIPWTAPATAGENIRFYAAGIAANHNGSSDGDSPVELSQPLVVTPMVTNTNDLLLARLELRVLGNPLAGELRLSLNNPEAGSFRFSLATLDGRRVWNTRQWLPAGASQLHWPLPELPHGHYILQLESSAGTASVKVVR